MDPPPTRRARRVPRGFVIVAFGPPVGTGAVLYGTAPNFGPGRVAGLPAALGIGALAGAFGNAPNPTAPIRDGRVLPAPGCPLMALAATALPGRRG